MKLKSVYLAGALAVGLVFIGVTFAQKPASNIDATRHPALAEAQNHIIQAYEKTEESQKHYKDQLGGHAQKAEELLAQASKELKEASEYADAHH